MRLGDLDALKRAACVKFYTTPYYKHIIDLIDNSPTIESETKLVANVTFDKEQLEEIIEKANADILAQIEIPQGEWIDFAQWVAKEVLDDYFEDCSGAFAEIACRKLVKLGLVEVEGDVYKMKGGADMRGKKK